jgi:hypothetical protein
VFGYKEVVLWLLQPRGRELVLSVQLQLMLLLPAPLLIVMLLLTDQDCWQLAVTCTTMAAMPGRPPPNALWAALWKIEDALPAASACWGSFGVAMVAAACSRPLKLGRAATFGTQASGARGVGSDGGSPGEITLIRCMYKMKKIRAYQRNVIRHISIAHM